MRGCLASFGLCITSHLFDGARGFCCPDLWFLVRSGGPSLALALAFRFGRAFSIHMASLLAIEAFSLLLELLPFGLGEAFGPSCVYLHRIIGARVSVTCRLSSFLFAYTSVYKQCSQAPPTM